MKCVCIVIMSVMMVIAPGMCRAASMASVEFSLAINQNHEPARTMIQLSEADGAHLIEVKWGGTSAAMTIETRYQTVTVPLGEQDIIPCDSLVSAEGVRTITVF